ncbi:MAG TPA: DUF4430 domain-containing protein [Solirubrobacteraceae bacterium]|nr:DUF4430 domain-containing protein [Solirubrobacteraceae bacterium]
MRRPPPVVVAVLAVSLALAGCGLGAGRAPSAVQVLVTRDFGGQVLHQIDRPAIRGEETVMSLLKRNDAAVGTRYGGGFVQSIDGVSGGQEAGEPVDWFYYVNGIQAGKGAAATKVHPGDHIWWDHHDWSQTEQVPAVVGSFPEPFLNGIDGKRVPVRIDCAEVAGYACRTVAARFRELAVPAGIAGIGSSGEPQTLHVLVGRWGSVRHAEGAQAIDGGPRASGVYARFSTDGSALTVLDERGRGVRKLLAGTGLVAATRHAEDAPVWVVTGTDLAGVNLAARAFETTVLHNHFAVAVTAAGALPAPGR